jgi:hypothetical protein
VFLVFEVVPCVDSSIRPLEGTFSMHLVVPPLAFVVFSIGPDHPASPLNFILIEFALVLGQVGPDELPGAMLQSVMMLP